MISFRTFIAFDIEDEGVLRKIGEAQSALAKTGADLKIVEPKNVHVTLRFLGEIPPATVDKVYEEMKKISFAPFDIKLKGIGAFPSLGHLNVIWIGIEKGADEVSAIFSQLEPKLNRLGFAPERRGFSPHLTIARVRTGRNKEALVREIMTMEGVEFGTIKASSLRLKKSILTPQGPIYSTLHEVRASP